MNSISCLLKRMPIKKVLLSNTHKFNTLKCATNYNQPKMSSNRFDYYSFSSHKNIPGSSNNSQNQSNIDDTKGQITQKNSKNENADKNKQNHQCQQHSCSQHQHQKSQNVIVNQNQIPKENLQISHEEIKLGEQLMDCYETKGGISILSQELVDKIKGAKLSQTGQLYALVFTCGKCNTKAIRSFTKNAYHHGTVMVRCEGCQAVHLVADNLGWFEDEPTNLDSYSSQQGKMKKVTDPIAVSKFLKAAFGDKNQKQNLKQTPKPKNQ